MYAIATLIMNGNRYVPGAIALARSLRLYSNAQLVCMITSDVDDRDTLEKTYDHVVVVDKITINDLRPMATSGMIATYGSWIHDACTKWRALALYQYSKVLFMDADMIAVAPIDDLFLLDVPAAVFDSHFNTRYVRDKRYAFTTDYSIDIDPIKHGDKVPMGHIDTIINSTKSIATPNGGLILLEPSRFAMNMLLQNIDKYASLYKGRGGIDEFCIMMLYHSVGYQWTSIDISYNVATYHIYQIIGNSSKILHYITPYKPWEEKEEYVRDKFPMHMKVYKIWHNMFNRSHIPNRDLSSHLYSILSPILGSRVKDVLDKYLYLYRQALTTSKANIVSNYELMEAYGDRMLAGQYVWLMMDTPGIISADQVTKISSFFQNRYSLEMVCDYLDLSRYISKGRREVLDTDTKSDVVESLIAAIAISWEKMYGEGNNAIRLFIHKIWSSVFTIDPINYISLYEEPKTVFKQLAEKLQVNRSLINTNIQDSGGDVMVTVLYGKYPMGIGRASVGNGIYHSTAVKLAEKRAYSDALKKRSLQLLTIAL